MDRRSPHLRLNWLIIALAFIVLRTIFALMWDVVVVGAVKDCSPFANNIFDQWGTNALGQAKCAPDDKVDTVGHKPDSFLILDMGVGNEIVDGPGTDFYYYERFFDPGVLLDWVEIAVAQDDGSEHPATFTVVFIWGDDITENNGLIPSTYNPEEPNKSISSSDLYNGTGIGINIGNDDGATYRFVRFQTHPTDAVPPEDQLVEVDAVERVISPTPPIPTITSNVPTVEITPIPTDTFTPTPTVDISNPQPVRPILECVVVNLDGSFTAYFGYQNDNAFQVNIPLGTDNQFSPAPQDRGQSTVFGPGRTSFWPNAAFVVPFDGNDLVWTLNGRTSTASRNSTRCGATPTFSPTPTATETPTFMPTITSTSTYTQTSTATLTSTATFTPTMTSTPTDTQTSTATFTATVTFTPTNTPTATYTPTITSTSTDTLTPTQTRTPTATVTPSQTSTVTYTPVVSLTPSITSTSSNTPTVTATPTATFTPTNTSTPTATRTPRPRPTNTPTKISFPGTPGNTSTPSAIRTPTATRTLTKTPTATVTKTSTPTKTPTRIYTPTNTSTATNTPTLTSTITSTIVSTPMPNLPNILPSRLEVFGVFLTILTIIISIFTGILPEDQKKRIWKSLSNSIRISRNKITGKSQAPKKTEKTRKSDSPSSKRRRK